MQQRTLATLFDTRRTQGLRFRLLTRLFGMAKGTVGVPVSLQELLEPEVEDDLQWLVDTGVLERPTPETVRLTDHGAEQFHRALANPHEPTDHFPPVASLLRAQMRRARERAGRGDDAARSAMGMLPITVFEELDQQLESLGLTGSAMEQLLCALMTVEAQFDAPEVNLEIARLAVQDMIAALGRPEVNETGVRLREQLRQSLA